MPGKPPPAKLILKKAAPALLMIFCIFISLLFLITYTDAFYLVILIWIIAPVILVKAYRWLVSRIR